MSEKRWHVYPTGDLKEHELSEDCWCRPEVTEEGVVVHNSLDRRELFEEHVN